MAAVFKITGIPQLVENLKKAHKNMTRSVTRGLVKGGQFLQAESQKIVPVQTGNLRASAFTRKKRPGHVIVGYTAPYAVHVHERLDLAHGRAFNVKYAAEIAKAGKWSTNITSKRTTFRPKLKMGTARGGMFPRGENQQAKFLEKPMREKRTEIFDIVSREALKP